MVRIKRCSRSPDRGGGTLTVTGPDAAGRVVIDHRWPDDTTLLNETHTTVGSGWRHWHMEFREGHPTSCRWQGDFGERYERADWGTNLVLTRFELSSTVEAFQLKESIRATHDGAVVFERQWNSTIRRDLM